MRSSFHPTDKKGVAPCGSCWGCRWRCSGLAWGGVTARAADAKVVLIAGRPSHGPGEHEFNAGIKLLAKCLEGVPGIEPVVVTGGWPQDEASSRGPSRSSSSWTAGGAPDDPDQGAAGDDAPADRRQGVGLVCLHYAVEVPKGEPGERFLEWLGGYYEPGYSDNPHNNVTVVPSVNHPIVRGAKPFLCNDEWYFKIRFRPEDPRVTPILTAKGLVGHDKKTYAEPQVVAWATERRDGGRSFGFTGAHFHKNWGIPEFRTLVLNAIAWTAKQDVPSEGIQCAVTEDELARNLDPKGPPRGR